MYYVLMYIYLYFLFSNSINEQNENGTFFQTLVTYIQDLFIIFIIM